VAKPKPLASECSGDGDSSCGGVACWASAAQAANVVAATAKAATLPRRRLKIVEIALKPV